MHLNEFSYALMAKNPVDWLNYYAVVSLNEIGIIPIFLIVIQTTSNAEATLTKKENTNTV